MAITLRKCKHELQHISRKTREWRFQTKVPNTQDCKNALLHFVREDRWLLESSFFQPMLNNTSPRQDKSVPHMEYTTSRHRGHSPSRKDKDDRESKKYVLVLTPPRHTSGGLLSSWLVDQQITFDGQRWPLLCPPCPRWWASHRATPPTVLGPGMGQDSSAC